MSAKMISPNASSRAEKIEFTALMLFVCFWAVITLVFTADRINWFLDAGWVAAGVPLLWWTRSRFRLTPLLYRLLTLHALTLIAGAFWTYEQNPLGLWLKELLHTERNHYDRFGHFMQGFVPFVIFREIYARKSPLGGSRWLSYFAIVSATAFSALFELLEWAATVAAGAGANEFLGYQGDIWDAQWDMLWAIIGALFSFTLLARLHDRQLSKLR